MKSFRSIGWLSLIVCGFAAAISPLLAAETTAEQRIFTASEQAARQKILDSGHWQETREKFKQWHSLQSAYDSQQLASQEAELKQHIGSMSAAELQQFLDAMDERLEVLLSPGMDQARRWVDHYYTEKAQRKMAKKLGVEQPLSMTGGQLTSALERFQEQRATEARSSATFNRARQSGNKALGTYRTQERSAQAKASSKRRSASYGSHYAPQKIQKRQTRYPSSSYTGAWRGWGGW